MRGGVAATCALALLVVGVSASADRFESEILAEVASVVDDLDDGLAALGVTPGAPVTLVIGVEADTPPAAVTPTGTVYVDAITDLTITIGSFVAEYQVGAGVSQVLVSNDFPPQAPRDAFGTNAVMTTTEDVMGQFAVLTLVLQGDGDYLADDAIAQDLSGAGTGSFAKLGGTNGLDVQIAFGGSPPPGTTPAPSRCPGDQLLASSGLSRAVVACWAKWAKASEKDPQQEGLGECLARADERFAQQFDRARVRRDAVCRSVEVGATAGDQLSPALDAVVDLVVPEDPVEDRDEARYRSRVLRAASQAVGQALALEGREARKRRRNPERLEQRRDRVDARLAQAVTRAAQRAERRGVIPDVAGGDLVEAVNAVVDDAVTLVGGE